MTVPSEILQAIAARLGDRLSGGGDLIAVRAHDGRFGQDGKTFVTFPDPCILVFVADWNSNDEFSPPMVDARFVAVCLARTKDADAGQDSPSDVAMDLASAVCAILEAPTPELWPGPDEPYDGLAFKRPYQVRAANETTNGLLNNKGHAMWSVSWRQMFQLDASEELLLTTLKRIHFTLAMGPGEPLQGQLDDATADIEIETGVPL